MHPVNAFQLRRDGFVDKIPEEMPLCHEKDKKDDDLCALRSNDRFGLNISGCKLQTRHNIQHKNNPKVRRTARLQAGV